MITLFGWINTSMDSLLLIGAGGFGLGVLAVLLFLLSLFLVFLIMIQRGKGGGIAGSLTGTAQSAFGARGGDMLMWWTIAFTGVWIFLSCITIYFYSSPSSASAEQENEGGADNVQVDDSSAGNGMDSSNIIDAINTTDADDSTDDAVDDETSSDVSSDDTEPAEDAATEETAPTDSSDE